MCSISINTVISSVAKYHDRVRAMAEDVAKNKGFRTSIIKLIHKVETVLVGELDIPNFQSFKLMLTEKIDTLAPMA